VTGPGGYAAIDIDPGYQLLKGQDALDYVRYRHTDDDFARAARQQGFLRQARAQPGVRKLVSIGDREKLMRMFRRYFRLDRSFSSPKQVVSMIKLAFSFVQGARASTRSASAPTTRRMRRATRGCTPRPSRSRPRCASSWRRSGGRRRPARPSGPRARPASQSARERCPGWWTPVRPGPTRRCWPTRGSTSRSTSRACAPTAPRTPTAGRAPTGSATRRVSATTPTGSWSRPATWASTTASRDQLERPAYPR